jgi:dolichyl-phosphate beta-glucosyltransferase
MAEKSVAIVVPIFNEERRLPGLLEKLERDADAIASACGLDLRELMLIDDGSTDGTPDLLETFARADARATILRFDRNRGKGAAVREGMLASSSSLSLMTDVDLSTPLEDFALLAPALDAGADIAIASRAMKESRVLVHQPAYRELMGKAFNVGVRLLTGLPWRDTQCGFKLFRRETTRRIFEVQRVEGFAFDVEVLVLARRLGMRIDEVPVRWIDNPDTRVGAVTSSTAMALDLLRIAYRARRPLPAPTRTAERDLSTR